MPIIRSVGKWMIKQVFLFLGVMILFLGCSQKSAFSIFEEQGIHKIGIDYTQIAQINYKKETKAMLNVTYLNSLSIDTFDKKYENFLIGVYISDDEKIESQKYINNPNYFLTLNDNSYQKVEVLKKSNPIYKKIALLNPYAKYYIVSFEKKGANTLKLQYKHLSFGKAELSYLTEL